MLDLKNRITTAMKNALRAREKERLSCIRLILAEIKQVEIDTRSILDDNQIVGILDKMSKQRRDSIAQFTLANRQDLVEIEQNELEVIADFLPMALTDAEVDALIDTCIQETSAKNMADMGKVMTLIRNKAQGQVNMSTVSSLIKHRLTR